MGIGQYVRRFYQTNLANGEFRKHKGGYLAAALVGYLVLHATCGCAPNGQPYAAQRPDAAVRAVAHAAAPHDPGQMGIERIVGE